MPAEFAGTREVRRSKHELYDPFHPLSPLCCLAFRLNSCGKKAPEPGTIKDEALMVGRTAESFPAADEDYFKAMDGATRTHRQRNQGTQQLDRLDRRQRSFLGFPRQQ